MNKRQPTRDISDTEKNKKNEQTKKDIKKTSLQPKNDKSSNIKKFTRSDKTDYLLFYTASVNKVVSGGRRLRFVNYVVYCNKDCFFGLGKGKSLTFIDSMRKASFLSKKHSQHYFINNISIPRINIKFKTTKLIIKPRSDKNIVSSTLISTILTRMNVRKGMSIRILGSKHKINVVMALLKFLELTNKIYEQYEKKDITLPNE